MLISLQIIFYLLLGILIGAICQHLHIILKQCTTTSAGVILLKPVIAAFLVGICHCKAYTILLCLCLGISVGISLQPVGLTGGIACGKSSVSDRLKSNTDCAVIDVDAIAHSILDPDTGEAYKMIVKEFGSNNIFVGNTKKIDRRKLGEVIFPDPIRRRKLNNITHPIITRIMIKDMIRLKCWYRYPIVVVDIPLLFEGRLQWLFGLIVVVACSPDVQLERLHQRNTDLTKQQCQDRISSQMPIAKKCELAHFIINNEGSKEELDENVHRTLERIRNLYGKVSLLQMVLIGEMFMALTNNFTAPMNQ